MTLKELFIKRNDRMNNFRLNYYATVLVISGYLAVAGTYWVLPIVILSYLNLKNYSLVSSESEFKYSTIEISSIDRNGDIKRKTDDISSEKLDDIKSYIIEDQTMFDRKLSAWMNLELIIACLAMLYRFGISE